MGNLLKTNTRFYKDRIQAYIRECITLPNTNTTKQKVVQLLHHFDVDYNYDNNKKRMPNLQDRVGNWLQCCPSAISLPFYYVDMIADATRIHKAKALTDKEKEKVCNNFTNHLAYHILKYAEELKINLNKLY
jgi:hypothetical protein